MIGDILVAGTRPCRRCSRLDAITAGLDRLARLAPLTPEDAEDLALMACAGCVEEVACVDEPGLGWVLNLAPAAQGVRP